MTTDSGNYAARATALRETAKWTAAVFAGAGAVLFSGLSFTNLEKVAASDTWYLPVGLAVLPVLAAAAAIISAARLISLRPPDIDALLTSADYSNLRKQVEQLKPATVATFDSIAKFQERLADVRSRVATAEKLHGDSPTSANRKAADDEYEKLSGLQDGIRDLLLCADFAQAEAQYHKTRRTLLVAACVGVIGAASSGVVATRSGAQYRAIAVTSPLAVTVYVVPDKEQPPCPVINGQPATAIGGTLTKPLLLFPAIPATPATLSQCHVPWTWEPPDTAVIVVPTSKGGSP